MYCDSIESSIELGLRLLRVDPTDLLCGDARGWGISFDYCLLLFIISRITVLLTINYNKVSPKAHRKSEALIVHV